MCRGGAFIFLGEVNGVPLRHGGDRSKMRASPPKAVGDNALSWVVKLPGAFRGVHGLRDNHSLWTCYCQSHDGPTSPWPRCTRACPPVLFLCRGVSESGRSGMCPARRRGTV